MNCEDQPLQDKNSKSDNQEPRPNNLEQVDCQSEEIPKEHQADIPSNPNTSRKSDNGLEGHSQKIKGKEKEILQEKQMTLSNIKNDEESQKISHEVEKHVSYRYKNSVIQTQNKSTGNSKHIQIKNYNGYTYSKTNKINNLPNLEIPTNSANVNKHNSNLKNGRQNVSRNSKNKWNGGYDLRNGPSKGRNGYYNNRRSRYSKQERDVPEKNSMLSDDDQFSEMEILPGGVLVDDPNENPTEADGDFIILISFLMEILEKLIPEY